MSIDRAEELFHELLDLSVQEREFRLREIPDSALRSEVESLIAAFGSADTFLNTPPSSALPGQLGRYPIESEIGRGANGVVYLATDTELDRPIAIKTLGISGIGSDLMVRLREEAKSLASVLHPNVAQVYSIETIEDSEGGAGPRHILTMEYVPGSSLAALLHVPQPSLETCCDIGRQIAAALEAVHQRGIVHRDLKPENIRITPDGWVKVLDFGLATLFAERSTKGSSAGTPGFMSPEQCRGEMIQPSTDLWAFGCVLYESLTGTPAIRGNTLSDIIEANRKGDVQIDALTEAVPESIGDLLARCLDQDPRNRPSATRVRQLLEDELLRLRASAFLAPLRSDDTEAPSTGPAAPKRGFLPRPLSSFVERNVLFERVRKHLAENRLVTLTGPGGVGKTRTSLELAARMDPPGGSWFVDLSAITSDEDVPAAVGRTLRVRESGGDGDAFVAGVAAALGPIPTLLILDNCEHVLAGVRGFLPRLLMGAPETTALTTSRQELGIDGEQVVPLPPLSVPTASVDDTETDAVRLFLLRARARNPEFSPQGSDLECLAEICRRFDGLPLAIELAASRARSIPLAELLQRVSHGGSLPEASESLPERHRSLRSVVDWSYRLLSVVERALLRRLSIFRGGCTLEAAESVCGGWGEVERWDVCNLLTRLVERSLVELDSLGSAGSPARYRVLETIRLFAEDRLTEDPDEQAEVEDRYLDQLVTVSELLPEEQGPTRAAWIRRIEPDYANLVHAMDRALQMEHIQSAFALGEGMSYYWIQAGQWVEGLRWMERLLAGRRSRVDSARGPDSKERDPLDGVLEVRVMAQAGLLAGLLQRHDRAAEILSEAISIGESVGDPRALALAHEATGVGALHRNDIESAGTHIETSRNLFERAGDIGAMAVATGNLGVVEATRGNQEGALTNYREYLRLGREMQDRLAEAKALMNIGWTQAELGFFGDAKASIEEALAIHDDMRDLPGIAMAHQNLGILFLKKGELREARGYFIDAGRIRVKMGDNLSLTAALLSLGQAALGLEERGVAAGIFTTLIRLYDEGNLPYREEAIARAQELLSEIEATIGAEKIELARSETRSFDLAKLLAWVDTSWRD